MGPAAVRGGLRRLALPATLAAVGLAILIGLGLWQLERLAWKNALIATLETRLADAAQPLPPKDRWASLTPAQDEFRRVSFTARFLHDKEAAIFAGSSGLRPDVKGVGYWIVTPAQLADGSVVMVNRGFVPEEKRAPLSRPEGQTEGSATLIGVLRWPEQRGLFTPRDQPDHNLWFVRDHHAIAAARGLQNVAPFYVDLESPRPPGDLPRPGALQVALPNNHLQYALTWFALALALAAVFTTWAIRRTA
jgi:surfeit locus 1 family protein